MKGNAKKLPEYRILEFTENPQRKNIYDLNIEMTKFSKFRYFRLQTPRQSYLINQGAKFVCESWEQGEKILHTGLISTGIDHYYFGDFLDNKKTCLMIFHFIPETSIVLIYYFNGYNKKSLSMKRQFCREFITTSIQKSGTQTVSNVQIITIGERVEIIVQR